MNAHALGALNRIARAGVKLALPGDASVIVRLHELGEAIDNLTEAEDKALLTSCIEARGITFHRLSLGARHFLLDDVLPCIPEKRLRIAQAWVSSLERTDAALAPFRGHPDAIRRAVRDFERTCPLDGEEINRVLKELEPPVRPVDTDSGKRGDRTGSVKAAPLGTIIEALAAETGSTREYLVFEASEDYIRTMWRRRAERKAHEAWLRSGGKGPEPQPDRAFNVARKRLRDYEAQVIAERLK